MPETTTALAETAETTVTTAMPYLSEYIEENEANPIMLFFVLAVLLFIAFLAIKGGILRMGCPFCTRGGEITCKWKSGTDEDTRKAKYCPMCRRKLNK